jgi:hypothetical protein
MCQSSVQERHQREKKEYVAPPGLEILRKSSGYKEAAPDGAEDAPQLMSLTFKLVSPSEFILFVRLNFLVPLLR